MTAINSNLLNRKGARKVQDIPKDVLELLNQGRLETVNLTEWLAIDHSELVPAVFPELGINPEHIDEIVEAIRAQKKPTAMKTTQLVGSLLYHCYAATEELDELLEQLGTHTSDTVRCYAPYLIGLHEKRSIGQKLEKAQPFAADKHFGVREVVWMALRPEIDANLEEAVKVLTRWTGHEDENVRRFTTEATRPRGVWCKHIEALKAHPQLALPILENLKSDGSKYVQDSVGNWLNDASKSAPDFVIDLCSRWTKESPTPATKKIIKRARRTLDKK